MNKGRGKSHSWHTKTEFKKGWEMPIETRQKRREYMLSEKNPMNFEISRRKLRGKGNSMSNPATVAKVLSKVCQRPNKLETKCGLDLEEKFPSKFKYVGNGLSIINGKSPDYISEELKVVVLCNGLYWHLWRFG